MSVLLVVPAVLAGCSVKARDTISARSVEAKIATQLASNYHIPRPPVDCPVAVPAQVGSTFTCTATLDGQPLVVDGRVTGQGGRIEVHATSAVIVTSAAEAGLAKDLGETFHQAVRVSCAVPALLVAKPGHTFDCQAAVGSYIREVVVTVTSSAGALSPRLLPYKAPGKS